MNTFYKTKTGMIINLSSQTFVTGYVTFKRKGYWWERVKWFSVIIITTDSKHTVGSFSTRQAALEELDNVGKWLGEH